MQFFRRISTLFRRLLRRPPPGPSPAELAAIEADFRRRKAALIVVINATALTEHGKEHFLHLADRCSTWDEVARRLKNLILGYGELWDGGGEDPVELHRIKVGIDEISKT